MVDRQLHDMFKAVHNKVLDDHESKGGDYESPAQPRGLESDSIICSTCGSSMTEQFEGVKFTDSYPNEYAVFLQVQRKFCRLKALIGDPTIPGTQKKPNHESIADNARDLAAFAIWLSAWSEIVESLNGEKEKSEGT